MNTKFNQFRRVALSSIALAAIFSVASQGLAQTAPAPVKVKMSTSMGDILIELDANKAPKSVENFVKYVQDKHYEGTIFHRVMDGFMIQGGGFTTDMGQKPVRSPIALESNNGLKNDRGTIAMARTNVPNSATAQFFINVVDNSSLNAPLPDGYGYAVFGKVTAGMDVVDKIRTTAVANKAGHANVPVTPITINKVTIEK